MSAELAQILERARYGGYAPQAHELDQIQRRAERQVADAAPKDTDARKGIKLIDKKPN